MPHMLILGMGYSASRLADRLRGDGWRVTGVRRAADVQAGILAFDDDNAVLCAIATASHILSSVPPLGDLDPVLHRYGSAITTAPAIAPTSERQVSSSVTSVPLAIIRPTWLY